MEFEFALPILDTWGPWVIAGFLLLFYLLELIWPLRATAHDRIKRYYKNIGLALVGLPLARLLLLPLSYFFAGWCAAHDIGLLHFFHAPFWLDALLSVLILDYGIYIWHRLMHLWPFLWRFHNVHHIDPDMDISTGIRFHFGEMLLSIPMRLLVIGLGGVSPWVVLFYEVVFETATLFHHSNLKIRKGLERMLAYFIITPKQHGIHHSKVQNESNSNYGTVFNFWDRLHRSLRLNIPQSKVEIGVPGYEAQADHRFGRYLILPFQKQRPWRRRNGQIPQRDRKDLGGYLED